MLPVVPIVRVATPVGIPRVAVVLPQSPGRGADNRLCPVIEGGLRCEEDRGQDLLAKQPKGVPLSSRHIAMRGEPTIPATHPGLTEQSLIGERTPEVVALAVGFRTGQLE